MAKGRKDENSRLFSLLFSVLRFVELLDCSENGLVDRVDKVVESVVFEVGVAGYVGAELCLHNLAGVLYLSPIRFYTLSLGIAHKVAEKSLVAIEQSLQLGNALYPLPSFAFCCVVYWNYRYIFILLFYNSNLKLSDKWKNFRPSELYFSTICVL